MADTQITAAGCDKGDCGIIEVVSKPHLILSRAMLECKIIIDSVLRGF
jgi:hypothetical protein